MQSGTACHEKEDDIPPVISVSQPASVPVITVPDSVLVVADIADDKRLEFVEIGLLNADRVHVADPVRFFPQAETFGINAVVKATAKDLSSGSYYILIRASDGINAKNKYLPLTIHEMPLEIKAYLVIANSGKGVSLEYLHRDYSSDTVINISIDVRDSRLDSYQEILYLLTPFPSSLWAFPIRKPDVSWTKWAPMPSLTYSSLFLDRELVVGSWNGDFWMFDHSGQVIVNSAPEEELRMGEVAATPGHVACGLISYNAGQSFIRTYFRKTGGLNTNRWISGDVACIVPAGDEFLVGINAGPDLTFNSLDPETGVMTILSTLHGENLAFACEGPAGEVFFSTGERIRLFDNATQSFSVFSEKEINGMTYDRLNSLLYYYVHNGFGTLQYPSGMELSFHPSDAEVLGFHVIFNR